MKFLLEKAYTCSVGNEDCKRLGPEDETQEDFDQFSEEVSKEKDTLIVECNMRLQELAFKTD